MTLPRIIITGASGFIGRRLLDGLKEEYQIFAIGRRSQLRCGAPFHDNILWHQVDIGEVEPLATAFQSILSNGPIDYVVHLAAHYDFTGEKHPEYWRTNVEGLRNVLEQCKPLALKRFIFASSVAACNFPPPGRALNEKSTPDGEHIYAMTKRIGEEMLAEYDDSIPSCIVRFAAMFSDWCEYPPLYFFLDTWLSRAWNSRILGGRGLSAIPYLHVREVTPFFRRLLASLDEIDQREVIIASPCNTLNHRELFDLANLNYRGHRRQPFLMPGVLCRLGVWARDLLGRALGNRPFERPWMVKYIDAVLAVDATRSYGRIGWKPRDRLQLYRRMPFLVENLKIDPVEWHRRNQAALKEVRLRTNLRIHRLLEKYQDEICRKHLRTLVDGADSSKVFPSYQKVPRDILEWRFMVILRHLQNSVRTGDRGLFTAYCKDLAEKRIMQGFDVFEVCNALESLNSTCLEVIRKDPESADLEPALRDYLTMTVQFGCDQVLEVYEELGGDLQAEDEEEREHGAATAPEG
jgi:nucleoside-diphosphate-sugar epimerase